MLVEYIRLDRDAEKSNKVIKPFDEPVRSLRLRELEKLIFTNCCLFVPPPKL